MANRSPLAGGFFLIVAMFAGLGIGLASGQVMAGVLIGTAVGAAIALAVWALDRRRRA